MHPPTLVLFRAPGRPANLEGARPTFFRASKANERVGTP
jgi:hypothetical protein